MKRTKINQFTVLTLVLSLVTIGLLGASLAKYTTELNGYGSATVANWSFTATGIGTSETPITLTDSTLGELVTDGDIAPGTDGSFAIGVDGTGSDVAIGYTIAFSELTNKPDNLTFYSDSEYTTAIDLTTDTITGTLPLTALTNTETIYWQWPYASEDITDTSDSANADVSFNIIVTGTQVDPSAATE